MIREEIIRTIPLEAGGVLENAHIVFHTSGKKAGKVIWIYHAMTSTSNPEDWWPGIVGPGKIIDTDKNFVICVNMLGSPFGSESPRCVNPKTGKPWMLDFPRITMRDSVKAMSEVRKHLGINRIDVAIGVSNGGYHALEWAVSEPTLFDKVLLVATAPRITPFIGASIEAQRMALEVDPTFREAKDLDGGLEGLKCARAQGIVTYRSFKGFVIRLSEEDDDTLYAQKAASYERYQGEKIARSAFDAYCYYAQSCALDSHNVGRGRGGVKKALEQIVADTVVVNVDTDLLFPPEEGREWSSYIPKAHYTVIKSDFGHDGILLEIEQLKHIVNSVL